MVGEDKPQQGPLITEDEALGGYKEASQWLGFPPGTLYSLVHAKRIPHIRLGKRLVRFSRPELERWLASNSVPVVKGEP